MCQADAGEGLLARGIYDRLIRARKRAHSVASQRIASLAAAR